MEFLPKKPGVYIFKNAKHQTIYIGKALSLLDRVKSYFTQQALGPKTKILVSQIKKIDYIEVESDFEALLLEAELIKKRKPKYNIKLKDDKGFIYIKITDEELPRIFPSRKKEGTYGPFPKSSDVKNILRQIRAIFPYCSSKNPKRSCLYVHLGLCPAPYHNSIDKKSYRRIIANIKKILEGKSDKLLRQLYREINQAAKSEKFEQAANLRDQITRIKWLMVPKRQAWEYIKNPNLIEDTRRKELTDLQNTLLKFIPNFFSLVRIEAYDVSNINGLYATGSMAVFVQGEPDKSEYRRFQIRSVSGSNDVAMISETIRRRLNHTEWDLPGLVLVDGGKGQVGAALGVLKEVGLEIPVVGLAKRLEEIVVPEGSVFKFLRLKPDRPALNLLKRIRDEAHRFARGYHLKLRERI